MNTKTQYTLVAICAAMLSGTPANAATLNLTGQLYTESGLTECPIQIIYDSALATPLPWVDVGYTLATPANGGMSAFSLTIGGTQWTEQDDYDYPAWPGLVLLDDQPFSVDFVVISESLGAWRLRTLGVLSNTGTTQLFLDGYDGQSSLGLTAENPVPDAVMAQFNAVPEPRLYGVLAGLMILGFAGVRRYF